MSATVLEPEAAGPSRARRWIGPLLWIALTAGVLLALRALPWRAALAELSRADGGWLLAAAACNAAILPLWAREWMLLARPAAPVSFRAMLGITSISSAVLNTIPFLAGEMSAVALLVTRAGLTRAAAMTVLAMDQLLVGVAKLAALGAAAALVPLPRWVTAGTLGLASAVAGLTAVVLLVAWRGRLHVRSPNPRQPRLGALLVAAADVDAHLLALHRQGALPRVVLLALAKKALEMLAVLAVQRACGIDVPAASALLVVAALGLSTLLPVAPANLGVYEATVFLAYRYLGVGAEDALAASVLQHVVFVLPLALPGWILLSLRQLRAVSR